MEVELLLGMGTEADGYLEKMAFVGNVFSGRGVTGAEVCRRSRVSVCAVCEGGALPPIYFVLGGPGSGKGTQCGRLVSELGFAQIGAGDLLREKAKDEDERGRLVEECIRLGKIVPGHITIQLLDLAVRRANQAPAVLIDGFPREIEQAHAFENQVARARAVIFFSCSVPELKRRILHRGRTSGRVDDNEAAVEKRLVTFEQTTMPVVQDFKSDGRLRAFDGERPAAQVYQDLVQFLRADLSDWGAEQVETDRRSFVTS